MLRVVLCVVGCMCACVVLVRDVLRCVVLRCVHIASVMHSLVHIDDGDDDDHEAWCRAVSIAKRMIIVQ